MNTLYNEDCLEVMRRMNREGVRFGTMFADPPDNIGLNYSDYADKISGHEYEMFLRRLLRLGQCITSCMWISFNAKHTVLMGHILHEISEWGAMGDTWTVLPCVQTFTFGQHRHTDLGNNHRPLWRIMKTSHKIYPENIRVPSWRLQNGDKRANPEGRVPGDVFDFPRVTGNSKQRRKWHPTQLHEGLVERCLRLTNDPALPVFDPFAGTGTVGRVCSRIGFDCVMSELSPFYCAEMVAEGIASQCVIDREKFLTGEV